jgi:hypothetical protein
MRILKNFDVGSNFVLSNKPKRMRWAEGGRSTRDLLNPRTFKVVIVNSQEKRLRERTSRR